MQRLGKNQSLEEVIEGCGEESSYSVLVPTASSPHWVSLAQKEQPHCLHHQASDGPQTMLESRALETFVPFERVSTHLFLEIGKDVSWSPEHEANKVQSPEREMFSDPP